MLNVDVDDDVLCPFWAHVSGMLMLMMLYRVHSGLGLCEMLMLMMTYLVRFCWLVFRLFVTLMESCRTVQYSTCQRETTRGVLFY